MFPGNPYPENMDDWMPAHTKGREGNLVSRTQIRNLRMSDPLNGVSSALAAGHPLCQFVPCSVHSGRH
jgi:hypothetical protein